MPAYSFKAQFVEPIKKGFKKQTIRGKRKNQAKPGDKLYLYYGMRTKWCTKILETVCRKVDDIRINRKGTVYINGKKLSLLERGRLAIADGFLSWSEMEDFWNGNNTLPFEGDIIHW